MLEMVLCLLLAADDALEKPAGDPGFETQIRPILVERCYSCHGPTKQWGSLRLDSREAVLRGGDNGPAVVPGKPGESRLLRAIQRTDPELKMPPDGEGQPLTPQEIQAFANWIERGAAFPATAPGVGTRRDAPHWAFQPLRAPAVPHADGTPALGAEVDQFLAVEWQRHGLTPASSADKRTLIRRVTFDLTGLPPSPEDIDAFVADDRPDAYSRLVDRLLASPAYGERWGRNWLDVARYADSNGLDENICHGNAWRYRDYVVRSLNADKPWSQFIREQLAGDLLAAVSDEQRNELWTATGFLAIGPKVLAEVDQTKMRMDIIDEQVDTVGRVFLGMTFGCARCHHHKFDPIDLEDYYGLAGIFKSTKTMISYTKVAKWHEHELKLSDTVAMRSAYESKVAAQKQTIASVVAQADEKVRASLTPGQSPPEKLETVYPEATKQELAKLRETLAELEKNAPEYPAVMGVTEDQIADVPIHVRGNHNRLGAVVPRRFPQVMRGPAAEDFTAEQSGRVQLANWLVDSQHPLTARVLVNRIWRWHFGEGLVRTTDNFGVLGEKPSHPELLDWLAWRFIQDGWSLKKFQRRLLLSRVYQFASESTPEARERDPENRWLSRFSPRRLQAEEIRDAMLAVSGQLDQRLGGSLLQIKNRGYFFDHTSIDKTDYSSRRRSLYLPVVRNNVYDLFQLLDFPDPAVPTGDRATTTVPPQALLMMNSPLVMQSAESFAARLLDSAPDDRARLRLMSRLAFGRDPDEDEVRENEGFLTSAERALTDVVADSGERRRRAWNMLTQVCLASSEFIYLR